jgi:hypothetical protein
MIGQNNNNTNNQSLNNKHIPTSIHTPTLNKQINIYLNNNSTLFYSMGKIKKQKEINYFSIFTNKENKEEVVN